MPNIGITIDLYSRYQQAFGYVAKGGITALHRSIVHSNVRLYKDTSYSSSEQESSPVLIERGDSSFANVLFESDGISYSFGLTPSGEILADAIAPPMMVSFSRGKNIVTTVIDNSDFEVVESFGTKTWEIQFDGILVDMEKHWYPSDLVKLITQMFSLNKTYKVTGDMFLEKGITELYFTDLSNFTLLQDYNDTVKFSLKAKSIQPTEFFIY